MPVSPDPPASAVALPPPGAVSLESALSAEPLPGPPPTGRPRPPAGARARPRLGLRAGLGLMLGIGLLPALLGITWHLHLLREQAVNDAYSQADLVALGTAERLRWMLQDAQALLGTVAARPQVRALDPAACDPLFQDFGPLGGAYKALALRGLDGRSICSELRSPPSAQSVAQAPWFQAALQRRAFHASDAHLGAVQQTWTARLTHPVLDSQGQIGGLLVAPLDLGQLQQRLFAQLPPLALAAVIDGSNHLLVRSAQQEARVGRVAAPSVLPWLEALQRARQGPGPLKAADWRFTERGIDGVRRLYVLRPVPLSDWTVVASLPEAETLQPYEQQRRRTLAAAALVLALAAAVAVWLGRGILVPMRGLAAAARGMAAGDESQRAPETGPREVAEVAAEFNRMVRATSAAGLRLRASEAQYRTLLQHLPVAVVVHRAEGSIEVFNDLACSLLRMSPAQMEGRSAVDHAWHFVDASGRRVEPHDYPVNRVLGSGQPLAPALLGIVSEGVAGTPATSAAEGASAPPPHTWAMVQGYPQFDDSGRLQRAVIVFVDVTLQRHNEQLRVAKEAAEAASKAKSVFLSRVSHELRTPLNAIIGFSELSLLDEQMPAASKERLRHVLRAGRHLLVLINQILDLTRIEAGQLSLQLQPLALAPVLQGCLALCGPLAHEKGVTLTLAPEAAANTTLQVRGDETALRQVLINLLSNAIKYNRAGGRVAVAVALQPTDDGEGSGDVAITITDTGPGLTAAQQEELFQPFSRLGAEFSGVEGHGLGLSISRLLADAMGGQITVRSTPGEGSAFTLHLQRVG